MTPMIEFQGTQSRQARSKIQMFGAWCAILYVVILVIGWAIIAGFLPPHLPSSNDTVIAAIFQSDTLRIRAGMILTMVAAMILAPFVGVLTQFVSRIEGPPGVIAYSSVIGGLSTIILTFYPAIWWLIAAFRPDRDTQITQMLNDMSWLQLIGGITIFLPMPLAVALASLTDSSPEPVFPRWAGFANIWLMVLIIPDQLIFFFYTGPFAWNGLFGFWIPLTAFAGWFILTFVLLRKAILRERGAIA
jgi:MFS family permease